MLNISHRRVGGLRFIKLGRLTVSFSVSKAYKPLKGSAAHVAQCNAIRANTAGLRAVAAAI